MRIAALIAKPGFAAGLGVWIILAARAPAAEPLKPTHADVSFGPHEHQLLDIYLPPQGDGPFPVLLWFGGIWKPAKHPARLDLFGPEQIAVIAVQTRTMTDATDAKCAEPISYVAEDACRAVQFVRAHADRWKLDPERIAVGGGSQGALPALFVACAGERADPKSKDPLGRVSTKVTCVGAYRCQPTIDPKRMQEWVPGVEWGAPALGCGFRDSLKRYDDLLPVIRKWSPDHLLHRGTPPIYFENEWGLTRPDSIAEDNYKVHSPAWAIGFQTLAKKAGVVCFVKYPGHPTENHRDIWDFLGKKLKEPTR